MARTAVLVFLTVMVGAGSAALAEKAADRPNVLSADERKEGWKLLFDGRTTKGWSPRSTPPPAPPAGPQNAAATTPPAPADKPVRWLAEKGELFVAPDSGKGPLATTAAYGDFVLRLEFWIDEGSNSGVFFRAPDSGPITQGNAFEVNLFDGHPQFPTGSINGVQKTSGTPRTVGKWNRLEVTARGEQLLVVLNDEKVVEATASRLPRGPIAFQYAPGIKFRSVRIKNL
jgi:hypothetical protein